MKNAILLLLLLFITISFLVIPHATAKIDTEAEVIYDDDPPTIEYMFVLSDTGDPDHVEYGTQILPEPGTGNNDALAYFNCYAVVSDPNSVENIQQVYEKLLDNNDYQVLSEMIAVDITDTPEQYNALTEALDSNLITQSDYNDMISKLEKEAKMFRIENYLTIHNEPGDYKVCFKVIGKENVYSENYTNFEYESIKMLGLDFNSISYGKITTNEQKKVDGDNYFDPAGDSTAPTVKNQGNIEFRINISATDMIGENDPTHIIPTSALSIEFLGQSISPGLNNAVTLDRYLMPGIPTRINFGVIAPYGTPIDIYNGQLSIVFY
ncbi:hypothetical protein C5S42_02395 [Candidatus Methanomarinus sp.]|nr:hypothetical protein C5S42_02395 [ANME-2 cluster archaeon]